MNQPGWWFGVFWGLQKYSQLLKGPGFFKKIDGAVQIIASPRRPPRWKKRGWLSQTLRQRWQLKTVAASMRCAGAMVFLTACVVLHHCRHSYFTQPLCNQVCCAQRKAFPSRPSIWNWASRTARGGCTGQTGQIGAIVSWVRQSWAEHASHSSIPTYSRSFSVATKYSGWWFQPLWNIWVKLGSSSPNRGWK